MTYCVKRLQRGKYSQLTFLSTNKPWLNFLTVYEQGTPIWRNFHSHIRRTELFTYHLDTETKMSSFWWNFHHWLHWKLSVWQLSVQPVMKNLIKMKTFPFQWTKWISKTMWHENFLKVSTNPSNVLLSYFGFRIWNHETSVKIEAGSISLFFHIIQI